MKTISAVTGNNQHRRTMTFGVIAKLVCLAFLGTKGGFAMRPAIAQVGVGPIALPAPPALP